MSTPRFKVGDLAQWKTPLCVVRIASVDRFGYGIQALPGLNGTPLDVKAFERFNVGFDCLDPIDPDLINAALQQLQATREFHGEQLESARSKF